MSMFLLVDNIDDDHVDAHGNKLRK